MAWTNPNTVHNPTTGAVIPASWGAMVNQNLLHLRNSPETAAAYRNTTQTINNATVTAVSFTTELWDNANMWQSPNPTRFRAPVDGRYLFTASVSFQAHYGGLRTVWLRDSRSGVSFGIHRQDATSSDSTNICCSGIVGLLADDYVEVYVEQTSGGTLGVNWARAALIRLGG
jgi:hypothetical protein